MIEKWHVVKVSEENREKYFVPDNYVVFPCNDTYNKIIKNLGDTIVLTTPSKDLAESIKKALDEQLRK